MILVPHTVSKKTQLSLPDFQKVLLMALPHHEGCYPAAAYGECRHHHCVHEPCRESRRGTLHTGNSHSPQLWVCVMGLPMESMIQSSTAGLCEGMWSGSFLQSSQEGSICSPGTPQSLGEGVIHQQGGKHSHSHTIKRETDNQKHTWCWRILNSTVEMAQWGPVPASKVNELSSIPTHKWRRERTESCELYPGIYTRIAACAPPHTKLKYNHFKPY